LFVAVQLLELSPPNLVRQMKFKSFSQSFSEAFSEVVKLSVWTA